MGIGKGHLLDIVRPDPDLSSTPTLGEALHVVQAHQGPFGGGSTPPELLRLLEWFVDYPYEMVVIPSVGSPPAFVSECVGDMFRFVGLVHAPSAPSDVGVLMYDVSLTPGAERAHLERYEKRPATAAMSLKPHLRRAYLALVRAGIPVLELEAGLQSGPTYWANAGVQFRDGRPLLAHLELVAALLAGAGAPPALSSPKDVLAVCPGLTATVQDAYAASEFLSAATATPRWVRPGHLVHMRDNLKIPIDQPVAVGEAILFAISPWDGRVDLTDPGASDALFRSFLGV